MGLRISVYRHHDEWPSDDVSATVNYLTIVNVKGPCAPDDEAPAYMLAAHDHYPKCPVLMPVDQTTSKPLYGMASGAYAGTSDGRWTDAVAVITGNRFKDLVGIYDRFEGGRR